MQAADRLVGRAEDLAALDAAAAPGTMVTVTGPGGVGKTSLVDAFVESRPADASPAVVAHLADLSAGSGVDAVAQQLGFPSIASAALALAAEPRLVVLDNCEHVRAAAADAVAELRSHSPHVVVVTTSREPLHVAGEHVVVLAPLRVTGLGGEVDPTGPATQLFLARAAAAGAAWTDDAAAVEAVAELCQRLDGLPLAIEIAAARTRATGPTEMLRLMEHRLDLLRDPGDHTSGRSERHRSVRAAIDVSVEMLTPDDATALRRMGVFAGPFDLELAHQVLGSAGDGDRPASGLLDTVDLLGRLVDRSLVDVTHVDGVASYRLLELVREHTRESARLAGHWDDTRRRFVAAMDRWSDEVVTEGLAGWSGDMLARATTQYRNLLAAIRWTLELDDTPDRAYRLMRPLLVAVHQGRSNDVLAVGADVIERWPDVAAPWRAEALAVLSTAAAVVADVDRLRELADAALGDEDRTPIADVLARRALALAELGVGTPTAALDHLERGIVAADEIGLVPFGREMRGILAAARLRVEGVGDRPAILRGEIDALASAAHAAGDAVNEGLAEIVRAQLLGTCGEWDEAERALDAAAAATEAGGYPWWTRAVRRSRAELASGRARAAGLDPWEASAPLWYDAADLAASRGALGELATTLLAAAVDAADAGHTDVAATLVAASPPVVELSVIPHLGRQELLGVAAALGARQDTGSTSPMARITAALDAMRGASRAATDGVSAPSSVAPARRPDHAAFRLDGDSWIIEFGGTSARVRRLKGVDDLTVLVRSPGTEIHCLELIGGADVGGGSEPGLDESARSAYQRRILDLQADIDEARSDHDPARAERAELELDALVEQLSGALGLGGRERRTGSAAERARSAVTYRIRSAVKRIDEVHPALGRHFANSVRTGTWCSYQPESPITWTIER